MWFNGANNLCQFDKPKGQVVLATINTTPLKQRSSETDVFNKTDISFDDIFVIMRAFYGYT